MAAGKGAVIATALIRPRAYHTAEALRQAAPLVPQGPSFIFALPRQRPPRVTETLLLHGAKEGFLFQLEGPTVATSEGVPSAFPPLQPLVAAVRPAATVSAPAPSCFR